MPVGKLRRLFSVYLDFCVIIVINTVIAYFGKINISLLVSISAAGAINLLCALIKVSSPGQWILSITPDPQTAKLYVDEVVYRNSNWATMVLGWLMFVEGTKKIVRPLQGLSEWPVYGAFLSDNAYYAYTSMLGIVSIVAGIALFKLKRFAVYLVPVVAIEGAVNVLLSWDLYREVIPVMMQKRRVYQGIPMQEMSESQQDLMVQIMGYGTLGLALMSIIAVFAVRRRLVA